VKVTPQTKLDLPRVHPRHRPVLQPELFTQFFRQADIELQEPLRTAVMLLPCCGLRASEMVNLRLECIQKADVRLNNGKTKKTLFLRLVGKGGKERHVPLMEEGVEILTGYLAGWRKKQKGLWLFPSVMADDIKGSKHISDRTLRHAVQSMRQGLGVEFTPHTMRRTYITTLYRKGVDLKTIAEIAGHANIQTTIDHYIITEPGEALEAFHRAGGSLTE
jgi:integrase/recombinase XerD